jgi:hypothetical protein
VANLFSAYDKLREVASHGFLMGAFFPWVFVLTVDVTIYELFIPDGNSLADRFLALDENDQVYAAIALVIGLAGLAAASDMLADDITARYRRRFWKESDATNLLKQAVSKIGIEWPKNLGFEQHYAWFETQLDERMANLLLMRVAAAQSAIKRSAILIIGFGFSILYNSIQLYKFQFDHMKSFWVLLILWIFMVIPLLLIYRQIQTLILYDELIVPLVSHRLKSKSKNSEVPP